MSRSQLEPEAVSAAAAAVRLRPAATSYAGAAGQVGTLHSVFAFLAFKNDIGFWKKRHSLEGLSIRTFFSSFLCQVGSPAPKQQMW